MANTDVSIAWVPLLALPLVIRGYRSAANDGGRAIINGNGAHGMMGVENKNYIHYVDLYVRNTGAEIPIKVAAGGSAIRCRAENASVNGIQCTNYGIIWQCYVYNVAGNGIAMSGTGASCWHSRVEEGPDHVMDAGIFGFGSAISRNIVILNENTSSDGIVTTSGPVANNSVWCAGGGTGIGVRTSSGSRLGTAFNNVVEGFSGVGGSGLESISTDGRTQMIGGNAVYDCTTPYVDALPVLVDLGDNEILTESPFVDAANGDFTLKDIGNLREGSLPVGYYNL